jgi:hypothetical protein
VPPRRRLTANLNRTIFSVTTRHLLTTFAAAPMSAAAVDVRPVIDAVTVDLMA